MIVSASALVLLSSCVSQKKYAALEAKQRETQDMLNTATVKLNACLATEESLRDQIADLRKTNTDLINTQGNLTTLSAKGAENLEKSLEQMKEKEMSPHVITKLSKGFSHEHTEKKSQSFLFSPLAKCS